MAAQERDLPAATAAPSLQQTTPPAWTQETLVLQEGDPPTAEEAGEKAEPVQSHAFRVHVHVLVVDAEVKAVVVVVVKVADQTAADKAPEEKDRQDEAARGPKCAQCRRGTRGSIKKCAIVDCIDFEVRKWRRLLLFFNLKRGFVLLFVVVISRSTPTPTPTPTPAYQERLPKVKPLEDAEMDSLPWWPCEINVTLSWTGTRDGLTGRLAF